MFEFLTSKARRERRAKAEDEAFILDTAYRAAAAEKAKREAARLRAIAELEAGEPVRPVMDAYLYEVTP